MCVYSVLSCYNYSLTCVFYWYRVMVSSISIKLVPVFYHTTLSFHHTDLINLPVFLYPLFVCLFNCVLVNWKLKSEQNLMYLTRTSNSMYRFSRVEMFSFLTDLITDLSFPSFYINHNTSPSHMYRKGNIFMDIT